MQLRGSWPFQQQRTKPTFICTFPLRFILVLSWDFTSSQWRRSTFVSCGMWRRVSRIAADVSTDRNALLFTALWSSKTSPTTRPTTRRHIKQHSVHACCVPRPSHPPICSPCAPQMTALEPSGRYTVHARTSPHLSPSAQLANRSVGPHHLPTTLGFESG